MRFQSLFVAVLLATALISAALLINSKRPSIETNQPTAALVKATGKCAACHSQETSAIVHEYEMSRHAQVGVTCLDCHQPAEGQVALDHSGFTIASSLTSKNCASCHAGEYEEFLRSRHAAPAFGAVTGSEGFTPEQVAHAERYHPGTVDRPANALARMEGSAAIQVGCVGCHDIGKPNNDGSIGTCTECHSRHNSSIELARLPQTCGQCHMGPDHSQLEIYRESKHGVLFNAQRDSMNLSVAPRDLTTADMPVPTCSTCHMSGLDGQGMTHDVGERLSWYLFAAVSEQRPNYLAGQDQMKATCKKCHAKTQVDSFYADAESVVEATNAKVQEVLELVAELRAEGLLTPEPFDQEIDFLEFDLWHYFGRTAKHGAFMGGSDFVQWHGNYELLHLAIEIKEIADELRGSH